MATSRTESGSNHRAGPRLRRGLSSAVAVTVLLSSLMLRPPGVSAGSTISVTTTDQGINGNGDCSLEEAIYAANFDDNIAPSFLENSFFTTGCAAGSGTDTIVLPANGVFSISTVVDDLHNPFGPTATPIVFSPIVIEGNGSRLERSGPLMRAFAVGGASVNVNPGGTPDIVSGAGALTIRNLHVKGFYARGGNGGVGAGGGLGAGGAIYVRLGSLTVESSTFEGNRAEGGNGGSGAHIGGGGGGGGLGGDGGSAVAQVFDNLYTTAGGGGGGARGDGGTTRSTGEFGHIEPSVYGGGGGGTVTDGGGGSGAQASRAGGEACGGDGGDFWGDGAYGCDGGGGGGGGQPTVGVFPLCLDEGGHPGGGGYGGGGGGGGYSNFFHPLCSTIQSRVGGDGGFGGGGGGGATQSRGGDGGFGGGGGGGSQSDGGGQGGTFGGHGGKDAGNESFSMTGVGGGGAGLGGAIFSDRGNVLVRNSTFTGNSVSHGFAGNQSDSSIGATNGQDAGAGVFAVDGVLTIRNATISGNESTGADAGVAMYRSSRTGSSATLALTNTIVAGNVPGSRECELLGSVAASGAGNLITNNVDCPGVAATTDPALAGLASQPPAATPTMAIDATSPAYDAGDDASCQSFDQRGISRPQSLHCDIGAYEHATIPPVTTVSLAPASPDGSNGWYRNTVGITVSASDVDGAVAQTRCVLDPAAAPTGFPDLPDAACGISSVGTDGEHALYAASIDDSGNVESTLATATFKVDQTPPTLSPSLNVTTVTIGQTGVVATANADDATSGLASSSCDPVDTSTPGVHSVDCIAEDHAGNTASASVTYVVEYRILGFFSPAPTSKWRAGQTVPVKIAVGDQAGTRISDSEAAALAAACRITFTAAGAQTKTAECLKYDAKTHQFIYSWKIGKQPLGLTTISVSISYPESAVVTTLSEPIQIIR